MGSTVTVGRFIGQVAPGVRTVEIVYRGCQKYSVDIRHVCVLFLCRHILNYYVPSTTFAFKSFLYSLIIMAYVTGSLKADEIVITKTYDHRTASTSCAYLLPHLHSNSSILDVGCGPGSITSSLAALVPNGNVIGVDQSAGIVAQATASYAHHTSNLTFAVADAESLAQFPDASFDVVHAHQLLMHVSDPVAALKAFRRVCKPGGVVATRDVANMHIDITPRVEAVVELWPLQAAFLRHQGSDIESGSKKEAWARAAGFERFEMRESAMESPTAVNLMVGTNREIFLREGIATQEQMERYTVGWEEWEKAENRKFAMRAADMLCFKDA